MQPPAVDISPLARKAFFALSVTVVFLITLAALASFTDPSLAYPRRSHNPVPHDTHHPSLADLALEKVLHDGRQIFGDADGGKEGSTATWMKAYHDDTLLVHMNLPGTHDAATWNYSLATQISLDYVNDLANITPIDVAAYRCQDRSLSEMLRAGIRVFDLRYALDVTRMSLVFWHGNALQSETATVDDVLYALYNWLDTHTSEAVFLSFQHEGGGDDRSTQMLLYDTLTSPAARRYVVQSRGTLGTLGEARGKITLLRRFDLDLLPASYEDNIPGLHFSPSEWTNNGANISLTYNKTTSATAYIEDYYSPGTSHTSSAETNIRWKLNATQAHLQRAATSHSDSLFWGFASSTNNDNDPPETPEILALGNGTWTPEGGVNKQLLTFFEGMKGKRLGIVMFDFFAEPEELVPTFLSLLGPQDARDLGKRMYKQAV